MLALPLRLPTAPYGGHMGHFLLSMLMLSGSAPFGNTAVSFLRFSPPQAAKRNFLQFPIGWLGLQFFSPYCYWGLVNRVSSGHAWVEYKISLQ